ncbi:cytochrome c oxidase subunit II [Agrobacterium rosae]|uniref:cytochrome c oxidase subunit II n=1 Tax=Agrobacterium rosae TaxID=1972867 RepID=UPI003B9E58F7
MLSGCHGELSTLDPAGPSTAAFAKLWWAMLAGSAIIFALVMVLLVTVLMARGRLKSIAPKHWIVLGGIILPIPILIALLGYAFYQGERMFGANTPHPAVTISATSRMWSWEFVYEIDGRRVVSRDLLHVPVGLPVKIDTTSVDVIHSFWVPRLGGKIDSIPGQVNTITLLADIEGTFGGVCSEYCGEGHAGMNFRVKAHNETDFENALRNLAP